ncbi:hypothetical protein BGZ80_010696 [Entomortierella chlamydospora]|uniref:Uncharacterized protein n=1 Tax=Entomortierella chlamydospora TaxID=101097 RepID=A0A9P6MUY9_9FUNG|nr:hypothetical protein BGZ79_007359 [Entomortierella chlamydospora]KAG0014041.1 hypothetical protein BGZ80_010696 [Entomortierella chlamydospora]
MDSRELLDNLVTESTHPNRPEVRAKSSIGLVSFVLEKSAAFKGEDHADIKRDDAWAWQRAWGCILFGLVDEWPLVRDAFREQLTKAFNQSGTFQQTIQRPEFMDQIIEAIKHKESAQDKMKMVAGILSLAQLVIDKEDGTVNELSSTNSWETERVNYVVEGLCNLGQVVLRDPADTVFRRLDNVQVRPVSGACASFTNSTDLWNKIDRLTSTKTITKSLENLVTIYQTTPWSIRDSPTTADSATSLLPKNDNRNLIMIPGSFSSNVIQIIEREIRPCFTHVKAQKLVDRAQTTIELHQEKIKRLEASKDEDLQKRSDDVTPAGTKDLIQQQRQERPLASQRIMIAPVTDTPNDEEEVWTSIDNESTVSDAHVTAQPRSWDKTFLGSIAVVEWCAQQPIQDPGRIHEVFMYLIGPILTMTDSLQYQYRIRGLDLLTSFLIQYHNHSGGPMSSIKDNVRKQVDSRTWIKIFDRTGLDQVLERSLKPLLGPLQVALTRDLTFGDNDNGTGMESSDELEAISAAFRAYLTLILVNTEQSEKPASPSERSRSTTTAHGGTGGANGTPLTVENLFVHAVLGSFKRANPSKEYRTLILEWAKILIDPVISADFLKEHAKQRHSLLNVVHRGETLDVIEDQTFQGIYGMGSLTMKYLPTLIQYTCDILDYLFPSSPPAERLKSLDLAWKASDVLCAIMEVSRPRVPRYRGKVLASISNCWANSRIFSSDTKASTTDKTLTKLSDVQLCLDRNLTKAMQLCIEICRPKVTEDANSGLEMDLKVLRELDPSVFDPLFVSE